LFVRRGHNTICEYSVSCEIKAKDALCKVKPCSFNGVYQPNILDTFPSGGILALSYFYDRIFPLLPSLTAPLTESYDKRAWGMGGKKKPANGDKIKGTKTSSSSTKASTSLPISEIAILAERVCAGPESWKLHWGPSSPYARSFAGGKVTPSEASKSIMDELNDRPEYCLDLTFMHALLRLGYEFGSERDVRVEKKVDGVELGWCLGATLALLLQDEGNSLQCVA